MDVDTFVGKRTRLHAVLLTALTFACNNQQFSGFTDVVPDDVAPTSENVAGSAATASGGTGSSTPTTPSAGAQAEPGESAGEAGQGQGGSDEVIVAAGAAPAVGEAGAAGAGGAIVPLDQLELVDDVEGAFPEILQRSGRNGFWYWAQDDSGGWLSAPEAVPLEPPRLDSYHAAHISGGGFTSWGALLGVSILSPFGAYDASAYCAVRFAARGVGDGWALRISDRPSEPATGQCGSECYNYLGRGFEPSAEWQEFEIRFDELEPAFGGNARALESNAVYAIRFAYENTSGAAFELTVDDLAFVPKAACQ